MFTTPTTYAYALGEPVFKIQNFLSRLNHKCVRVVDLNWEYIAKYNSNKNALWLLYRLGYTEVMWRPNSNSIYNITVDNWVKIDQMNTRELKRKLMEEPDNSKLYFLATVREDVVELFDQNPYVVRNVASDCSVMQQLVKNVHAMPIIQKYITDGEVRGTGLSFSKHGLWVTQFLSNPALVCLPEQRWKLIVENLMVTFINHPDINYMLPYLLVNPDDTIVRYMIDNHSKILHKYYKRALLNPNDHMIDWIKQHHGTTNGIDNKVYLPFTESTFRNTNPRVIREIQEQIEHHYEAVASITNRTSFTKIDYIVKQFQTFVNGGGENMWNTLATNPAALELIEKFAHKFNPNARPNYLIYQNPAAFECDYPAMRENMRPFAEEIIAKAMHPRRIAQWMEEDEDEEEEEDDV